MRDAASSADDQALPPDAGDVPAGRAVIALTGASHLCVGLGFSYLDRQYGAFGFEAVLWLLWTTIGFGGGVLRAGQPAPAGTLQWIVQGCVAMVLAVFPAFAMFNLLRWAALVLLLVMAARAAILRTRRDFYLSLTVVFAVSLMVLTHGRADWTLWFYLAPAWLFGGLALTWDHSAGVALPRRVKAWMNLGFVAACVLVATVLFLLLPRPQMLGFGFLPPGTATPGLFPQEGGAQQGGSLAAGPDSRLAPGTGGGSGWTKRWDGMLQRMRSSLDGDRFMPGWQRGVLQTLLDAAEALRRFFHRDGQKTGDAAGALREAGDEAAPGTLWRLLQFSFSLPALLALLLCAALAGLLGWWRWRIGLWCALALAWVVAWHQPAASMRLSARALQWCLRVHGHPPGPNQSVREHCSTAASHLPHLARQWLHRAMETYCAMRFGNRRATRQDAWAMREAVQGAGDLIAGTLPELTH